MSYIEMFILYKGFAMDVHVMYSFFVKCKTQQFAIIPVLAIFLLFHHTLISDAEKMMQNCRIVEAVESTNAQMLLEFIAVSK